MSSRVYSLDWARLDSSNGLTWAFSCSCDQLAGCLALIGLGEPHSCLVVGAGCQLVAVVTGPHISSCITQAYSPVGSCMGLKNTKRGQVSTCRHFLKLYWSCLIVSHWPKQVTLLKPRVSVSGDDTREWIQEMWANWESLLPHSLFMKYCCSYNVHFWPHRHMVSK